MNLDLLSEPAVIAAAIAAVLATVAAIYGHRVSRSNAQLQMELSGELSRLQTKLSSNLKLSDMRQAWINDLRDDMAAFQAISVTPDRDESKNTEFYRLGTRIELRMNVEDPDYPELQRCLHAFLGAQTVAEKYSANPAFVAVCQRILKREWDVLKAEIKSVAS